MRIGVIARRLAGQPFGIARYIEYLVKNWERMIEPDDRITLFVWQPLIRDDLKFSKAIDVKVIKPQLIGAIWENFLLPSHAQGLDVLFGPSYTVPLIYQGPSVVATHSVNEVHQGTHPWWYYLSYTQLYRMSAQRADKVIVPLSSTKLDVQKYYGIPAEKIEVVPEGADDIFRPLEDKEVLRQTRIRYFGEDRPYILFVGKMSQRRNIPNLIRAFAAVKQRGNIPHSLLLFGPNVLGLPLEDLVTELNIAESVVQTDGKVGSHEELVSVYNAADLYVYPSSYDGFSLTLVEAMACGLPVVTTNRAAIAEIAGGYALSIEEPTVEALTEAISRVLTDNQLREDLGAKSLERARAFRWENTAQRTMQILRQVAQEHQGTSEVRQLK